MTRLRTVWIVNADHPDNATRFERILEHSLEWCATHRVLWGECEWADEFCEMELLWRKIRM